MKLTNVASDVEKGLLDLAIDPDFASNLQFYM